MQRFILVLALLLVSSVAFGADKSLKDAPFPEPPKGSSFSGHSNNNCDGNIECTTVGGAVCRDACLKDEIQASRTKVLDGDSKGAILCPTCFKKDVNGKLLKDSNGRVSKTDKVCCMKKTSSEK
jgi:hypothetical protein